MSESVDRSGQYIEVLRQLPQFVRADTNQGSAVVHALTGAMIQGHLARGKREQGVLIVEFPGGRRVSTIGSQYLMIALKEAAEIELSTGMVDLIEGKLPSLQERIQSLHRHFHSRYRLGQFVWTPIDTLVSSTPQIPFDTGKDQACSPSLPL